jgi:hypothetical protein
MPDLFARPPVAPNIQLPAEAPNRPLGKDWLSDAVDALLGGADQAMEQQQASADQQQAAAAQKPAGGA